MDFETLFFKSSIDILVFQHMRYKYFCKIQPFEIEILLHINHNVGANSPDFEYHM